MKKVIAEGEELVDRMTPKITRESNVWVVVAVCAVCLVIAGLLIKRLENEARRLERRIEKATDEIGEL